MFDLEREVAAWSAAVHRERCQPAASVAELSDHLYCAIDRARAEGLSDEEAFRAATARLGTAPELTAEYAKNRSALGTACQISAKLDGPVSSSDRGLLVAHALVWAVVIIVSSLVLKRTTSPEISGWLLIGVFIPLWLSSDLILRATLRKRTDHGA